MPATMARRATAGTRCVGTLTAGAWGADSRYRANVTAKTTYRATERGEPEAPGKAGTAERRDEKRTDRRPHGKACVQDVEGAYVAAPGGPHVQRRVEHPAADALGPGGHQHQRPRWSDGDAEQAETGQRGGRDTQTARAPALVEMTARHRPEGTGQPEHEQQETERRDRLME